MKWRLMREKHQGTKIIGRKKKFEGVWTVFEGLHADTMWMCVCVCGVRKWLLHLILKKYLPCLYIIHVRKLHLHEGSL